MKIAATMGRVFEPSVADLQSNDVDETFGYTLRGKGREMKQAMVLVFTAMFAAPIAQRATSPYQEFLQRCWKLVVQADFNSAPEEFHPSNVSPEVTVARQNGDHARVVELLQDDTAAFDELVNEQQGSCSAMNHYMILLRANRGLENDVAMKAYARKYVGNLKKLLQKYGDKPESVIFIIDYPPYARHLIATKQEYEDHRAFLANKAEAPLYADFKDIVLTAMCDLAYAGGRYDEVLALCDEIDAWYELHPDDEPGRSMHTLWRVRTLREKGEIQKAITLLEEFMESPWGEHFLHEPYVHMIAEMQASLPNENSTANREE